jgi:hypothetical protein
MSESHGLATIEPLTSRVGLWRTRHRAQAARIAEYRVEHDGSCVATLAARSSATLDDELAAAAWELAQGVQRPTTVEVLALTAEGAEVARLPLRVLPASSGAAGAASSGDLKDVIKCLLDAHQAQARLLTEVVAAFGSQLRDAINMASELARAAHARAGAAEAEAASASAVVRDALAVARDAQVPERTVKDRGLDLVEGVLRDLARNVVRPAPVAPVAPVAPAEALAEPAAPAEAAE